MTIEKIKNNIDSKLGDNVKIIYNGSRNKKEEYSGIISETYNYIFIISNNQNITNTLCDYKKQHYL